MFALALAGALAYPDTRPMVLSTVSDALSTGKATPAAKAAGHRPAGIRPVPHAKVETGVSCAMLPAGIRAQESGGKRSAVSSVGAVGPDQIMPGNVGPWSREVIGRAVSVAEFRRSPALQDRVGRFKIGQYCVAYGPRGAAAAWYSGNPSRARDYRPIPNRSGPSVGAYVDSVMTHARKATR